MEVVELVEYQEQKSSTLMMTPTTILNNRRLLEMDFWNGR